MPVNNIEIQNLTKGKLPSLPFANIKKEILGEEFELSLVFVNNARSKNLNNKYRGKNKPTNILSFPLSKTVGEIFIAPEVARKDAPKFELNFDQFITRLFIHGLLHLDGMEHSSKMEEKEAKFMKRFGF